MLETPPKEPQAMVAACHKCGNLFKEDSVYCRRCGVKRPRAPATPSTEQGDSHSPIGWFKSKIAAATHYDHSSKRARVYESELQRRLGNLADVVGEEDSEATAEVLRSMCMCLATPKNERNGYDNEAIGMLSQVLKNKKALLEKSIAEKKSQLDEKQKAETKCRSTQETAAAAVRVAKDAHAKALKASEDMQRQLSAKQSDKGTAEKAVKDAEAALAQAEREKQQVDDLYTAHFLPLKNGTETGKTVADRHLNALMPSLRTWGGEDCLLAGFQPAAHHQPTERGPWCQRVVTEVEKLFAKPKKDVEDKVNQAKSDLDEAKRKLQQLLEEYAKLEKALATAKEKESAAAATMASKEASQQTAADELAKATAARQAAEDDWNSSKDKLQEFTDGPMTDFQWLSDHNEPEGKTLEHEKLNSLVSVDPQYVPKSVDQSGQARTVVVRRKLSDPRFTCSTVPKKTLQILSDLAGGAIAPSLGDRDNVQRAGVEMIKRALKSEETDALAKVDQCGKAAGYSPEQISKFKSEEGPKLIAAELENKQKAVSDATLQRDKACGGDCAKAEAAEQDAIAKHGQLQAAYQSAEDIYINHFLPLKKGTGDSRSHIAACMKFLQPTGCEDCLLAGFTPAAGHAPEARGPWCQKVMDEIEKIFLKARETAKQDIDKSAAALQKMKDDNRQAKALCENAKAALAAAEQTHLGVKSLAESIGALEALRAEIAKIVDGMM